MIQDLVALTMYLCKGLSVCTSSLAHVSLASLIWCVADAEIITGLEGSGPIFLDRLDCTPNDTSLLDCHSFAVYSLGLPQCDHSQDVSIRCRGKYLLGASAPSGVDIRSCPHSVKVWMVVPLCDQLYDHLWYFLTTSQSYCSHVEYCSK